MVSIIDVAKAAGVSDKTVSRVVNKEPNVRQTTRQKVEQAIEELGYVPNLAARNIRTNKSGVIGIMTDVVATTPNSVEILRGIQDRISQTNKSVLIANTAGSVEGEKKVWRTFREHRIDGVLFATMYHRHVSFDFKAPPLPMVLANCSSLSHPKIHAVVPDDYQGGYKAAKYLVDHGHSKIAYIGLNPDIIAALLRSDAFRDVMEKTNTPINEAWVKSGYKGNVGQEHMVAYTEARRLLRVRKKDRPTAILCGNDEIALQVMSAAFALNLKVPSDVAVIGFDDFQLISTRIVPNLTTIALPDYDIGARAAERLLELLAGNLSTERLEKMPCPLIARQSA